MPSGLRVPVRMVSWREAPRAGAYPAGRVPTPIVDAEQRNGGVGDFRGGRSMDP